jgi:hypothetical protein
LRLTPDVEDEPFNLVVEPSAQRPGEVRRSVTIIVAERSWRDGFRRRRSDSAARNCGARRRCLQ